MKRITSKLFLNKNLRSRTITTLKKPTDEFKFYENFKTKNEEKNKLPNFLNHKTENEFNEYFKALDKVRMEENNLGNKERVKELDEEVLKTLTILRESGISNLKLQSYYQYLISPLDQK